MRRLSRSIKSVGLIASAAILFGPGTGCLPDNFWIDQAAKLADGVIGTAISTALTSAPAIGLGT